MLAQRPVGPRAVAATDVRAAAVPVSALVGAFASLGGARYLAERMPTWTRPVPPMSAYTTVDDLIVRDPLVFPAGSTVAEVVGAMGMLDAPCAAVRLAGGGYAMVTDALIRHAIADGTPIADANPPTVVLGDPAAEGLVLLLDRGADFVLVTDRAGELRGVIGPRDFIVSPAMVGISLHEQVRRAATVDELCQRARRLPSVLDELMSRGLTAGKVISVHSAIVDTIVRCAIRLAFDHHPELSVDAFTWLALGSNGRHEAVLSSDVDSGGQLRRHRRSRRDTPLPLGFRRGRGRPRWRPAVPGQAWNLRAEPVVRPDQCQVAGRRAGVDGDTGPEQRRDHDVAAGGRPADPR